jgi:GNAT superfamily N-acetyltransferase
MELVFRVVPWDDLEPFETRDYIAPIPNGPLPSAMAAESRSERIKVWECRVNTRVVGRCVASLLSGEILFVGVLPSYEDLGIGKTLLASACQWLRASGASRIWLQTFPDPRLRSYGFYRAVGWRPTGERTEDGDEILEYPLAPPWP